MAIGRISGNAATAGRTYSPNCNLFIIRVRNGAGLPVNIAASSGTIGSAAEAILAEVNPLSYMVETGAAGNIHIVVDPTIIALDLQHRIRVIGANSAPVRGTGIYAANTFTYANTVTGTDRLDISGTGVYDANVINGAGIKITSKDGEPN
jgi:hypothetical protein